MKIITGKPAGHHGVRQVIVCPPGVEPTPGWYDYGELDAGGLRVHHGDDSSHSVRQRLHLAGGLTIPSASIYRAGGGPSVPTGAHVVRRADYPLAVERADVDAFIAAHELDALSQDTVARLRAQPDAPSESDQDTIRRWRGDIDTLSPSLWTSPRTLSISGETQAFLAAQLSSDYLFCSVLAEHSRWTYRTGWGGYTTVHGACATLDEALVMARAHLHRAWLGAVERVTELAGGRTDWLGGLPAPHEPTVYE